MQTCTTFTPIVVRPTSVFCVWHFAGAVGVHLPGRAGFLLADQRPSDRWYVHGIAEHRVVPRGGHGQDLSAGHAQRVDN